MKGKLTIIDFFRMFPDDETCINHIFDIRYSQGYECPKCNRSAKWYLIKNSSAFSCQWCGHHIHPMVGTLFEKSRTSLQLWFYAIYLFTTTRHGVSAKELQRKLGVTYKCAWRMGHEIRKHMALVDGEEPLSGEIEADETYIGGRHSGKRGRGSENKSIVFGMKQRGGDVMLKVVDDVQKKTLQPIIEKNVEKDSTIYTDEHHSYKGLDKKDYKHETVNHGQKEYVRGKVHVNGVENLWSALKRSIKRTHIQVSKKHLQKYAKEFEYRFNQKDLSGQAMFNNLISSYPAQA